MAFEDKRRKVRLSLRQADILQALAEDEALRRQGGCVPDLQAIKNHGDAIPVFHPEFGRFMLEATPGKPWGIGFKDLLDVEPNMKWRLVKITIMPVKMVRAHIFKGESWPKITWNRTNTQ